MQRRAVCQFLLFGLMPCGLWAQTGEIQLARFTKSANQFVAARLIEAIYQRAGLQVRIAPMPAKRANLEALAGRIDGEVSRIEAYANEHPTLIKVTPPYSYITISAFSNKPVSIGTREDLAPYRVGYVRGVQTSIDLVSGLSDATDVVNSELLFAMLEKDRFDVVIDVNVNGQFEIQRLGSHSIRDVGTLLRSDVYHMLAAHRTALAPRLSVAITQMKKSGELERLKGRFEREFVQAGTEPD